MRMCWKCCQHFQPLNVSLLVTLSEPIDRQFSWRTKQSTSGPGKIGRGMVMGFRYGRMEPILKDYGSSMQ
jgi:hypothetical protein